MEKDEYILLADDIHDEGEDTMRESCKEAFANLKTLPSICHYIKL